MSDRPETAAATRSPWLSVWLRPRVTIRHLADTDPRRHVLLLGAMGGIANSLSQAMQTNAGDRTSLTAVVSSSVIGGTLIGIASLFVLALLLRWTGRWLGGQAPALQLRTAMAWALVPTAVALALWAPRLAIFGHELFSVYTPRLASDPALGVQLLAFAVADLVLGAWTLVIAVAGVAAVQGFTVLRALASCALALLLLVAAVFVIVIAATLMVA